MSQQVQGQRVAAVIEGPGDLQAAVVSRVYAEAKALRVHPGYRDAVREVARFGLSNMDNREHVSRELRDRGSYLIAMIALALHATTGALTTSGLAAICVGGGLCSAGRVNALVAQLKKVGELQPEEGEEAQKRGQRLKPGPGLLGFYHDHFYGNAMGLSAIDARAELGLKLLAQGHVGLIVNEILTHSTLMGAHFNPKPNSGMALFTEHDSALAILQELISTSPKGADQPLLGQMVISVSGLSRRHVVSRPHVLKLLRDAQAIGALTWDAEARLVTFSAEFSQNYEESLSLILANVLVSYEAAAAKLAGATR